MTVEVVILAAGRGSRLGQATEDRPKCLVPLAGRAMLDWQLDALAAAGLADITLATGYRAEALARYGLATAHNAEWATTNMVASLLMADRAMRSNADLIVSYSDIVYEPRLVRSLLAAPGDVATVIDTEWLRLWRLRNDDPLDDAETLRLDLKGRITEIGRKPAGLAEIEGQYIGLTKLTAAGKRAVRKLIERARAGRVRLARPVTQIHVTDLLQGLIDHGSSVHAVATAGGWLEVDTESDLSTYESLIASGAMGALWSVEKASGA